MALYSNIDGETMVVVRPHQSLSVSVVLMAAVAACSASDSDTGRLIVQGRDEGQMDALIEGVVAIEDGCARLDSGGGTMLGLVWPVGTKWLSETNTIRTAGGDEVTNGSKIRAAGGAQSSEDLSYYQEDVLGPDRLTTDRLACAEQWWVLGNEFEILNS